MLETLVRNIFRHHVFRFRARCENLWNLGRNSSSTTGLPEPAGGKEGVVGWQTLHTAATSRCIARRLLEIPFPLDWEWQGLWADGMATECFWETSKMLALSASGFRAGVVISRSEGAIKLYCCKVVYLLLLQMDCCSICGNYNSSLLTQQTNFINSIQLCFTVKLDTKHQLPNHGRRIVPGKK